MGVRLDRQEKEAMTGEFAERMEKWIRIKVMGLKVQTSSKL